MYVMSSMSESKKSCGCSCKCDPWVIDGDVEVKGSLSATSVVAQTVDVTNGLKLDNVPVLPAQITPFQPEGFLVLTVNGQQVKIPYSIVQ